MSFAGKIISNAKHRFYYITANDNNGEYWYFMFIQPSKFNAFAKFQAGEQLELTDFGDILECGRGKQAPSEVIEEINRKYSCNFN